MTDNTFTSKILQVLTSYLAQLDMPQVNKQTFQKDFMIRQVYHRKFQNIWIELQNSLHEFYFYRGLPNSSGNKITETVDTLLSFI